MNIKRTKPRLYKNYFIVGEAIEAPILKGWKYRGIIYTKSRKELKKLHLRKATVWDKRSAYYYALTMCRYWIDNRQTELEGLRKRQRNAGMAKAKRAARFHRSRKH
jgi:hypothetical protein